MKTSKSAASLWDNANRRNNARNGFGDPTDALHPVVTIPQLIKSIGTNPAALELLAARAHELTPEQRRAALEAHGAAAPKARKPKAAKVAKAQPKAAPKVRSRLAGFPLRGFHSGAQT